MWDDSEESVARSFWFWNYGLGAKPQVSWNVSVFFFAFLH